MLRLSYDALHHEKIKGIRCPLDVHFSPTVTPRSGAIGNPMGKYFWSFAVNPKAAFAHCELCQQDWNEVSSTPVGSRKSPFTTGMGGMPWENFFSLPTHTGILYY